MVRRFLRSAFVLSLLYCGSADAYHLGPIMLGQERTEKVLFCPELNTAIRLAKEEEQAIEKNESIRSFLLRITPILKRGGCGRRNISYTPQEVMYEWRGLEEWSGMLYFAQFKIVRSAVREGQETKEIYVFTSDDIGIKL